jgi:hypothetical protein
MKLFALMSKRKRHTWKRRTKQMMKVLSKDALDIYDLIIIGAALIHERDRFFEEAEQSRKNNLLDNAQERERKGIKCNLALLHMNHPAAIQPND